MVATGIVGQMLGLVVRFTVAGTILGLLYAFLKAVYNLYFHPLAKYPGPFWARASRFWYFRQAVTGQLPFAVSQSHLIYGPVVRIGPDELSFTDAAAWKDIYGHRAGKGEIPKDPLFYDNTTFGKLSIISVGAQRHGELRRLLSHGFSEKALRDQEPIVQGYVDLMIRRLRDESKSGTPLDVVKWYNFLTFDVIGDLAFGESFGCLATGKMHPWIDWTFDLIQMATTLRALEHYPNIKSILMYFVPAYLKEGKKNHVELMTAKARHRLELKSDRPDFMTRMAASDAGLTEAEFIASADTVLLGGSETTATLLSGVTFYLTQNPLILEKLTQEIRSTFESEEDITFTRVSQLTYMLACIEETFRMYPPVPGALPRRTVQAETIAGNEVPSHTTLAIHIWAMNHSPKHFTAENDYIPERWLGDPRFAKDLKSAMQPFTVGPRTCIGRNLAYVEMRLVLSRLLFNFDIEAIPESKEWTKQQVFLLWKKPALWIKLKPRNIKQRPEVVAIRPL